MKASSRLTREQAEQLSALLTELKASIARAAAALDRTIARLNDFEKQLPEIEAYEQLIEALPDPLAQLTAEFDVLVARMQTPAAKSAVDALFTATPEQLGEAAVRGAKWPGH
ncbi:MAG TPA: hypothetical protein VMV98_01590 [Acidobacteriaceae bacterium]|nr:hypothetical protein [Acidobacteriaceae bacterium]